MTITTTSPGAFTIRGLALVLSVALPLTLLPANAAVAQDPDRRLAALAEGMGSLGRTLDRAGELGPLGEPIPLTAGSSGALAGLDGGVARQILGTVGGDGSIDGYLDALTAVDLDDDRVDVDVAVRDVEGAGDERDDLSFDVDLTITRTVDLPLFVAEEPDADGDGELDGGLPSLFLRQGRVQEVTTTTSATFAIALRVEPADDPDDDLHRFELRDPADAGLRVEVGVGDGGGIADFTARYGLLDASASATADDLDITVDVAFVDPGQDGTIDRRELAETNPADLFEVTVAPGSAIDLGVELTQPELFTGTRFDDADERVTATVTGEVVGTFPDQREGYYPELVETVGARFVPFDDLTVEDVLIGLGEVALAIRAGTQAGDVGLPLLDASTGSLVDPGGALVEFVRERSEALITCGSTDAAPPEGLPRDGGTAYCQAFTNIGASASSVEWTLDGQDAAGSDDLTVPSDTDATLGVAPEANVEVPTDRLHELRVTWTASDEEASERTAVPRFDSLQRLADQLADAGFGAGAHDLLAVADVGGIGTADEPIDVVTLDLSRTVAETVSVPWRVDDALRPGARLASVVPDDVPEADVTVDAAVSARTGIVLDPDLPRPGSEDRDVADPEAIEAIRSRFLLTDGDDDLVVIGALAVSDRRELPGLVGYLPVLADLDLTLGSGDGDALVVGIDPVTEIEGGEAIVGFSGQPGTLARPEPTTGWVRVADLIGYLDPFADTEAGEPLAIPPIRGFDTTIGLTATVDARIAAADAVADMDLDAPFRATWQAAATAGPGRSLTDAVDARFTLADADAYTDTIRPFDVAPEVEGVATSGDATTLTTDIDLADAFGVDAGTTLDATLTNTTKGASCRGFTVGTSSLTCDEPLDETDGGEEDDGPAVWEAGDRFTVAGDPVALRRLSTRGLRSGAGALLTSDNDALTATLPGIDLRPIDLLPLRELTDTIDVVADEVDRDQGETGFGGTDEDPTRDVDTRAAAAPNLARLLEVLDERLAAELATDDLDRDVDVEVELAELQRGFDDAPAATVPHLVVRVEVTDRDGATSAPLRVATAEQGTLLEDVGDPEGGSGEGSVAVGWDATTTVAVGIPLADGVDARDLAIVHDTGVSMAITAAGEDIDTSLTIGGQRIDAGVGSAVAPGAIGDYEDAPDDTDPATQLFDPEGAFVDRGVVAGEDLRVLDEDGELYATCVVAEDGVDDDVVTCDEPLQLVEAAEPPTFTDGDTYTVSDPDGATLTDGDVGDYADAPEGTDPSTDLFDPDAGFADVEPAIAAGDLVELFDGDDLVASCTVAAGEGAVGDEVLRCGAALTSAAGAEGSFDGADAESYEIDVPGVGRFALDLEVELAHPEPGASAVDDFRDEVEGAWLAGSAADGCAAGVAGCLELSLRSDRDDEDTQAAIGLLTLALAGGSGTPVRGTATGSGAGASFPQGPAVATLPASVIDALGLRPLDFLQVTTSTRFLERLLADAFDGALTGTSVPLLGTELDAGAGVAEVFGAIDTRLDEVGDGLEDALDPPGSPGDGDWDGEEPLDAFIGTFLDARFDDALTGLTVETADGATVTPTIGWSTGVDCEGTCDALVDVEAIRIDLDVAVGSFEPGEGRFGCTAGACETGSPVPFDGGVLGLPVTLPPGDHGREAVTADHRWEASLAVGIDKTNGPFIAPAGDEDTADLDLGAFATLAGADGCATSQGAADYSGQIGFPIGLDGSGAPRCADALVGILPAQVYDGGGSTDETRRSAVETGVTVRMADGMVDFGALLDRRRAPVSVDSRARINLLFETNAGTLYEAFGGSAEGAMPGVLGTFHAFASDVDDLDQPLYYYQALALDPGPFLREFLLPIAETVADLTDPFVPLLDIVTTPIPVVSDLSELTGGAPVTMLTLLDAVTDNDLTMLERLIEAVQFANAVATNVADLGGFVPIGPDQVTDVFADGGGEDEDEFEIEVDWNGLQAPNSATLKGGGFTLEIERTEDEDTDEPTTKDRKDTADQPEPEKGEARKAGKKEADENFRDKVGEQARNPETKKELDWSGPALSFPVLDDPDEVFGMLLGRDAVLVRFDAGTLKAGVSIAWNFGPFFAGPVPFDVGIGGSLTLEGRLALGFDTYGFSRTLRGESPFLSPFLDGLFLDDLDADGNDVDEIRLIATISLSAALSIKIIRAGLEGEVTFTIGFDLNDRRGDGRIRIEDIYRFRNDPICLFDVTGTLGFALNVFIEINAIIAKIKLAFTIWELSPPLTLFEITCDPPEPHFGRLVDAVPGAGAGWLPDREDGAAWSGAFRLHVGSEASERGIFTDETDERFTVRQRSAFEGVPVSSTAAAQAYDIPAGQAPPTSDELLADLGSIGIENAGRLPTGTDWVTILEVEGFGETLTYAVPAGYVVHADTGAGDDTILLEPGRELPIPDPVDRDGDGDDVDEDDADEFDFLVPAWIQADTDSADDRNRFDGSDGGNVLLGGRGNDTLQGGRSSDVIVGVGGDNSIEGSRGDNVLLGGPGNDQISGGPGSDLIVAGGGDNRIDGGPGLRPGTEPVGRTELTDTGNVIVGGSSRDAITGGPSTDYILAGGWPTGVLGDDVPTGSGAEVESVLRHASAPGATPSTPSVGATVAAGAWALDLLDQGGQRGAQLDRGLAGELCRAAGDVSRLPAPPDPVIGGNTVRAHRGDDLVVGGVGDDDLDVGRGDDVGCAPAGDNVLQANRGNNELHGGAGDDRLIGGPGDDWLTGGGGENDLDAGEGTNLLIGGTGSDVLRGGAFGELLIADGGPSDGAAGSYRRSGTDGFVRVTPAGADAPLDLGDWATDRGAGPSDGSGTPFDAFGATVTGLYEETDEGVHLAEAGTLTACEPSARVLDDGLVDLEGDGEPTVRGRFRGYPVSDGRFVVAAGSTDPYDGVIAGADVVDGMVELAGEGPEAGRLAGAAVGYDDTVLGTGETQRANCVLGGEGRDAVFGGPAADRIDAGFGDDFVDAGPGENLVRGGPGDTVLFGGPQGNRIFGDSGDDALFGGPGSDELDGGPGDDYLEGNQGDDTLRGGSGDDVLIGGSSGTATEVYLDASPGATAPRGWWASDLSSPSGDDTLFGERGDDLLFGDNARIGSDGRVSYWEPEDTDAWLDEAISEQSVFGGDDLLDGGAGENVLVGGLGDDLVRAGSEASHLFGDLAWFWPSSTATDTWLGGQPAWHGVLFAGEPFAAGSTPVWWDVVAQRDDDAPYVPDPSGVGGATHWPGGAARYDALLAAPNVGGHDHLIGSPQDDHLYGGAGDDLIEGGHGDDHGEGGPGDDRLYGESEAYARGEVEAGAVDHDLTGTLGRLFGERSGLLGTTGEAAGGNDLIGGSSSVHPDAADPDGPGAPSGTDLVVGGPGADVLVGDNAEVARRTVDAAPGTAGAWAIDPITGGRDREVVPYDLHRPDEGYTVDADATGADALGASELLAGDETLGGDDVVLGIDGPNRMYGGPGDDLLRGGPDDDYAEGGPGDDWIEGGAGDDDLIGGSSFAADQDAPDALDTGTTDLGTEGFPSGANVVLGQDGQNVLTGDNARILRADPDDAGAVGFDTYTTTEGRRVGLAAHRWVALRDLDDPRAPTVAGDDLLAGGPGDSLLFGQGGDDWLSGGGGDDELEGGAGDDVLLGDRRFGLVPDGDAISATTLSVDDLLGERPTILRRGHVVDAFRWPATQRAVDRYRNPFAGDDATGPTPVARLEGDAGRPGQDDLVGGNRRAGLPAGDDTIYGDGGDDVLLGDNAEVAREVRGAGTADERYARYDERYAADVDVDDRTVVRSIVEHEVGASLDDAWSDGSDRSPDAPFGDDFLDGGPGDDALHGQDGDDELWGSPVDDVADVDEDGEPVLYPAGESWGDHLIGGLGDDELYGGPGHDVLIGDRGRIVTHFLADDDRATAFTRNGPPFMSFAGLAAGDLWHRVDLYCEEDRSGEHPGFHDHAGDGCELGGAGEVADPPGTGASLAYSAPEYGGDDLLRGGPGDTVLYGAGGNDVLQGDTGADVLFGGTGDNVLLGGEGQAGVASTSPSDYTRTDDREHVDWIFGGRGESLLDYRPRVTPGADLETGWADPSVRLDPGLWFRASRPYWHPDDVDDTTFGDLRDEDADLSAVVDGAGGATDAAPRPVVGRAQHHQGVSWQYGGWGRKVLQGSVTANGPNPGDRLMDWTGAFNLYTHCAPHYGSHNILRALSPAQDEAIHTMALIAGAGGDRDELVTPGTSGFDQIAFVSPRISGSVQQNSGAAFVDARLTWGASLPGFASDEERADVGRTPGHFYDQNIACPDGGVAGGGGGPGAGTGGGQGGGAPDPGDPGNGQGNAPGNPGGGRGGR